VVNEIYNIIVIDIDSYHVMLSVVLQVYTYHI